ncbi:MAG: type II toxin-antitoxin system HipA family toxin [Balneolaceae bacterium]|nr:MAG: type II toxin-antitoxin system HipA family toxin [Balneolaceae bacterium]
MGALSATVVRGKEIFSFEYSSDFLGSDSVFEIDPNLKLYKGSQYLSEDERSFGIFLDSSPDRWGRVLMDRREAMKARLEKRPQQRLMESDYLLGVHDESRMGALRFKIDKDGPFLDDDPADSTPPMTSLRELERATNELEQDASLDDQEYLKRLSLLIAPGSSLGGARPKASVRSEDDHLWIAKFPSKNDEFDVGAWEYLIYKLALKCKVDMAQSRAEKFYSDQTTFMTKRFDRDEKGNRHHFFSAMTLLGYQDGADAQAGVSYLELVELLQTRGARISYDLEQLWRRIVFSICVSNTDDHLRNHGFMLTNNGLILSPAYDINPNPKGYGLNLNIDEQDNRLEMNIAIRVARFFRLSDTKAKQIVSEIERVVAGWKTEAEKLNISRREIEQMSPAFLPYL